MRAPDEPVGDLVWSARLSGACAAEATVLHPAGQPLAKAVARDGD